MANRRMGNGKKWRGPNPQSIGAATEDFRIYIDEIFRDFSTQNVTDTYTFPPNLDGNMRKYIHETCGRYNLVSKSTGNKKNRVLSIFKSKMDSSLKKFNIDIGPKTDFVLQNFQQLNIPPIKDKITEIVETDCVGRIFMGALVNVQKPTNNPLMEFRKTLPIYSSKDEILKLIDENQVVIISAETGSGKTTQVGQYILDDAVEKQKKIRVICTQPRRLSTISVSERVASERGEVVGSTVGYQIKLESKLGLNSSLIFCTNGVLLRTLMNGFNCIENVSHIVVDEIHERDKNNDFLLICLRRCLAIYPHLRVILMSATMDMDLFTSYFPNVKVLNVSGRSFPITSWFLDDILPQMNYSNPKMEKALKELTGNMKPQWNLNNQRNQAPQDKDNLANDEMDDAVNNCFETGDPSDIAYMMQLILNEGVSVNFSSSCNITPIIIAAKYGDLQLMEQLLNMGASTDNALETAQNFQQMETVNFLLNYNKFKASQGLNLPKHSIANLLAAYDRSITEDMIDHNLILHIIMYINENLDSKGGILVFLPGYDDILTCHMKLQKHPSARKFAVYMLHSSMPINAQRGIFKKTNKGIQKVIFSTNIAETSITIDDIRFVIDTGKSKQKSYDPTTQISSLKTMWISMASAKQRAGRAGRTQDGYCFHLYSIKRYESFEISTKPEILRTPLDELCLQTKILAKKNESIEAFLLQAVEPPSKLAIECAIQSLKNLGAIDENETLTALGRNLVRLSVAPRLAKMLIWGCVFKCLDPILTIVATLAHKDPFILPAHEAGKKEANARRQELGEDTFSDHFVLLRVFQKWQDAKVQNSVYRFCDSHFVSPSTMDVIMQTRVQLLSQLRMTGFVMTGYKDKTNELNSNAYCWPLVKACLAAGLYPNVGFVINNKLETRSEKNVSLHQSSTVKMSLNNTWLLYEEIFMNHIKSSIKCLTAVTPLTIALICGLKAVRGPVPNTIVLDDWYEMSITNPKIFDFRQALAYLINQKIHWPRFVFRKEYEGIIDDFVNLLNAEENYNFIYIPTNVGLRPKLLKMRPNAAEEEFTVREDSQGIISQRKRHAREFPRNVPSCQPSTSREEDAEMPPNQYKINKTNYVVCQKYPNLFPLNALYFIIKPCEVKNVRIGMQHGAWNFAPQTEKKLFKLFADGHTIILIFTVRNSECFQGIAKLLSTNDGQPNRPCPLEWITGNNIIYNQVKGFIHPKIHLIEDGQQLESSLGMRLCTTMYDAPGQTPDYKHRPILGKQRFQN